MVESVLWNAVVRSCACAAASRLLCSANMIKKMLKLFSSKLLANYKSFQAFWIGPHEMMQRQASRPRGLLYVWHPWHGLNLLTLSEPVRGGLYTHSCWDSNLKVSHIFRWESRAGSFSQSWMTDGQTLKVSHIFGWESRAGSDTVIPAETDEHRGQLRVRAIKLEKCLNSVQRWRMDTDISTAAL